MTAQTRQVPQLTKAAQTARLVTVPKVVHTTWEAEGEVMVEGVGGHPNTIEISLLAHYAIL